MDWRYEIHLGAAAVAAGCCRTLEEAAEGISLALRHEPFTTHYPEGVAGVFQITIGPLHIDTSNPKDN